jgi:hypothetical protein
MYVPAPNPATKVTKVIVSATRSQKMNENPSSSFVDVGVFFKDIVILKIIFCDQWYFEDVNTSISLADDGSCEMELCHHLSR